MKSRIGLRIWNRVALGFILYGVSLPLLSPWMTRWFPGLWRCAYHAGTGRPCPFCGLTTSLEALVRGQMDQVTHPWIALVLALMILHLLVRPFFLPERSLRARLVMEGTLMLLTILAVGWVFLQAKFTAG